MFKNCGKVDYDFLYKNVNLNNLMLPDWFLKLPNHLEIFRKLIKHYTHLPSLTENLLRYDIYKYNYDRYCIILEVSDGSAIFEHLGDLKLLPRIIQVQRVLVTDVLVVYDCEYERHLKSHILETKNVITRIEFEEMEI